jgi:hypothetical protein
MTPWWDARVNGCMNPCILQLGSRWRKSFNLPTLYARERSPGTHWTETGRISQPNTTLRRKDFCPALNRIPVIYSLDSHWDDSIIRAPNIAWQRDADAKFLRRFLKHTRRVSLIYWTNLNTVMKSSVFMGSKNPLSWLQQPADGFCLEPEEPSLHSHSPPLFSKILCNDVSQLKIEG